jgi:hypothetical protein
MREGRPPRCLCHGDRPLYPAELTLSLNSDERLEMNTLQASSDNSCLALWLGRKHITASGESKGWILSGSFWVV